MNKDRIKNFSKKILFGLIVVLALYTWFYLAVHVACTDCIAPVAQTNYVAQWLVTINAGLFIGILIFVRPWWKVSLLLIPGAIAYAIWYVPMIAPQSKPNDAGIRLTAATYNVLVGTDPEDVTDVIEDLNADIVALEEIKYELRDYLQENLSDRYPYQITDIIEEDTYEGIGLLSSYPILEQESVRRDIVLDDLDLERISHIRAVLDVEGTRVVVYVFHPPNAEFTPIIGFDDTYKNDEFQTVIEAIKQETDPVIALCDCNTTPLTPQYYDMREIMDDAYADQGWGLTDWGFGNTYWQEWPGLHIPFFRIDFIWHDDAFVTYDAVVWGKDGGSDHYPLLASLILKEDR
jgi:vancomycin resistance protein VanJ